MAKESVKHEMTYEQGIILATAHAPSTTKRAMMIKKTPFCNCCGISATVARLKKSANGNCFWSFYGNAADENTLLTIDHIIPRSKGGKSTDENLQILCKRCNSVKGNLVISLEKLKRLSSGSLSRSSRKKILAETNPKKPAKEKTKAIETTIVIAHPNRRDSVKELQAKGQTIKRKAWVPAPILCNPPRLLICSFTT